MQAALPEPAQMKLIFVCPVLFLSGLDPLFLAGPRNHRAGVMCWFNKTASTFLLCISLLGVCICIPWGRTGRYPVLYNIIAYWIKQYHAQQDRKPWEEIDVLRAAGSLETALHHHALRLIKPAAISWRVYLTNIVICSSHWDPGTAGPFPPS